ncbi:hypothetical protein BDF20DRAFT_479175 [Mycotypha africana]|uniref:uncharacterized protein n=1 Tax=Mycotypha africana TaxID=64632 RepID=UPI00230160FA|nr:uncharacterized protein BDF20DRAFT_479175 [Mycotypha africana]KAI8979095.1 hypothetical protein BDF20DRAFT_479175 [Mycotypha africana]
MQIKLLTLTSAACLIAFASASPVVSSDSLSASVVNGVEAAGFNDIRLARRQPPPLPSPISPPGFSPDYGTSSPTTTPPGSSPDSATSPPTTTPPGSSPDSATSPPSPSPPPGAPDCSKIDQDVLKAVSNKPVQDFLKDLVKDLDANNMQLSDPDVQKALKDAVQKWDPSFYTGNVYVV